MPVHRETINTAECIATQQKTMLKDQLQLEQAEAEAIIQQELREFEAANEKDCIDME